MSWGEDADEPIDQYRSPPNNIEAEQALLGAILVQNLAFDRVATILDETHFFEPTHSRIFAACRHFIGMGKLVNPVILKNYFEADGDLEVVGGATYLARLAGASTSILNADAYAQTIRDLAVRREIIRVAAEARSRAYDASIDDTPARMIADADQALVGLLGASGGSEHFQTVGETARKAMDLAGAAYESGGNPSVIGLSTGLQSLDDRIGALEAGMQLIIAGPTSSGKTALAIQIGLHNALEGKAVLVFSHEMTGVQLSRRLLAGVADIGASRIKHGRFSEAEYHKLMDAAAQLRRCRFWIEDSRNMTVEGIQARARQVKRQYGLDLMITDYLQILGTSNEKDNRVTQLAKASKGLRDTCGMLEVPHLLLSQLSRAHGARDNYRPRLSDLRESGAIEQDADGVLFVHREEMFLTENKPPESDAKAHGMWLAKMDRWAGKAEFIIAKMREGKRGESVLADFDGPLTRFTELAPTFDKTPINTATEKENQEALKL